MTTASPHAADVLVIGWGLAGLVAATEAAAAGKNVIIVDQEPRTNLGGQAFWSFGGLFFVDSPEQRRMGITDSLELAKQDWMGTAGFDRPEDDVFGFGGRLLDVELFRPRCIAVIGDRFDLFGDGVDRHHPGFAAQGCCGGGTSLGCRRRRFFDTQTALDPVYDPGDSVADGLGNTAHNPGGQVDHSADEQRVQPAREVASC